VTALIMSEAAIAAATQPGTLRGTVSRGMANSELGNLGRQVGFAYTYTDGKINIVPLNGYLPGEAIKLSASTGMIGWPEQTQEGINVTSLLNPAIHVQNLVQIDNADINKTQAPGGGFTVKDFPAPGVVTIYQPVTNDGFYKVLVVEHEGDSRGNPWYTNMVCLAVDGTAAANQATSDQTIPVPQNLPVEQSDPPIPIPPDPLSLPPPSL
jgi:hypothetical protein